MFNRFKSKIRGISIGVALFLVALVSFQIGRHSESGSKRSGFRHFPSSNDNSENWTEGLIKKELRSSSIFDDVFLNFTSIKIRDNHVTVIANTGMLAQKSGAKTYSQVYKKRDHYDVILRNSKSFIESLDGIRTVSVLDEWNTGSTNLRDLLKNDAKPKSETMLDGRFSVALENPEWQAFIDKPEPLVRAYSSEGLWSKDFRNILGNFHGEAADRFQQLLSEQLFFTLHARKNEPFRTPLEATGYKAFWAEEYWWRLPKDINSFERNEWVNSEKEAYLRLAAEIESKANFYIEFQSVIKLPNPIEYEFKRESIPFHRPSYNDKGEPWVSGPNITLGFSPADFKTNSFGPDSSSPHNFANYSPRIVHPEYGRMIFQSLRIKPDAAKDMLRESPEAKYLHFNVVLRTNSNDWPNCKLSSLYFPPVDSDKFLKIDNAIITIEPSIYTNSKSERETEVDIVYSRMDGSPAVLEVTEEIEDSHYQIGEGVQSQSPSLIKEADLELFSFTDGEESFIKACKDGDINTVELMLENGVVSRRNFFEYGWYALRASFEVKDPSLSLFLLKKGFPVIGPWDNPIAEHAKKNGVPGAVSAYRKHRTYPALYYLVRDRDLEDYKDDQIPLFKELALRVIQETTYADAKWGAVAALLEGGTFSPNNGLASWMLGELFMNLGKEAIALGPQYFYWVDKQTWGSYYNSEDYCVNPYSGGLDFILGRTDNLWQKEYLNFTPQLADSVIMTCRSQLNTPGGIATGGKLPLEQVFDREYLMELLIKHGADIDLKLADGNTLLTKYALGRSLSGSTEAEVKALLKFGANPTISNAEGKTPIQISLEQGETELAKLISENMKNIK